MLLLLLVSGRAGDLGAGRGDWDSGRVWLYEDTGYLKTVGELKTQLRELIKQYDDKEALGVLEKEGR